jgi:phosphoserine phosphatase
MNLVLQGPGLHRVQVDEIARLVESTSIETLSNSACRLRNAARNDGIASYCEQRNIDYAWMPEGRRFADLKLLALDMDSTLITIESIDELGDLAGKKAQIAAVTAQAMRGEIEYRESLRRRVAGFAGGPYRRLARRVGGIAPIGDW